MTDKSSVFVILIAYVAAVALLLAGAQIQTALAHEPSACPPSACLPIPIVTCPACPDCVTAPSPEQVQAVQRALDAIEAVEAMEAALPVIEQIDQGPGQVVPPPVLEAPLAP